MDIYAINRTIRGVGKTVKTPSVDRATLGRSIAAVVADRQSRVPEKLDQTVFEAQVLDTPTVRTIATKLALSTQDDIVIRAFICAHTTARTNDLRRLLHFEQSKKSSDTNHSGKCWDVQTRRVALHEAGWPSRWCDSIVAQNNNVFALARDNLVAEMKDKQEKVKHIQARLDIGVGNHLEKPAYYHGPKDGYETEKIAAAKKEKLHNYLAVADKLHHQLGTGNIPIVVGGKSLLKKRHNLTAAGLTLDTWKEQWLWARAQVCGAGKASVVWSNMLLTLNPDTHKLSINLPTELSHLANSKGGRYELSGVVKFSYLTNEHDAAIRHGVSVSYQLVPKVVVKKDGSSTTKLYLHAGFDTELANRALAGEHRPLGLKRQRRHAGRYVRWHKETNIFHTRRYSRHLGQKMCFPANLTHNGPPELWQQTLTKTT